MKSAPSKTRQRTRNRFDDIYAFAAGYCNDRPWRPEPGEGGGYAHWRCALRRFHRGEHRYRNYTWDCRGRTDYNPVPDGVKWPAQRFDRHELPRRRDARRQRKAFVEMRTKW